MNLECLIFRTYSLHNGGITPEHKTELLRPHMLQNSNTTCYRIQISAFQRRFEKDALCDDLFSCLLTSRCASKHFCFESWMYQVTMLQGDKISLKIPLVLRKSLQVNCTILLKKAYQATLLRSQFSNIQSFSECN
jgi:hypothetical protein